MNEQLKHAIEAMHQLSEDAQSVLAARILKEIEEIEETKEQEPEASVSQPQTQQPPCETEETYPPTRPLTGREFVEKLYREGKVLNIPTWKPLTEEEKAERAQLSQALARGKPLSEIVIEGRGPY
ncbi:MAG TPA: hypothetical protein VGL94_16610 [Ktedonobacteraceae bacterium]|jgi:hypothetical protein